MSNRIAWLNGTFLPEGEAQVSIFDRGLLFGDGVYDVATVLNGRLLDADFHLARLDRSCGAIGLTNPYSVAQWIDVMQGMLQHTGVTEGLIYVQVTRGAAERDFAFPANTAPTAFAYARSKPLLNDPNVKGVAVVSAPDIRWARRDIKCTSLMAPVLAKQYAREQGVFEAFMHQDGVITEGGSSNAFMVRDNCVVTQPLTNTILAGITRHMVLDIAEEAGIAFEQRGFTVEEALAADELFLSSATNFVLPVTSMDGKPIGNGEPGVITRQLRELYIKRAMELTT